MIRRLVFVLGVMFFSFLSYAQERSFATPDYKEIESLTNDRSSAFFYQELLKRYLGDDTTLTLRDYRLLYYGYFFQPNYTPFYHTAESDSVKMLLGEKEQLSAQEWNNIIRLGRANIQKNPFDLKGLNIVWVAYRQTGDSATARLYFDKLKKLVQTILSTGDGMTEATAFHVLNVSHEYDILNILGYEFGGNQNLTDAKCDYLSLKTNDDNLSGLYFDVKQIFKGYQKSLIGKE
jgi:hypothetical protein